MIFFLLRCLHNVKEATEHAYLISTCWFGQVDVHMFEGASLLDSNCASLNEVLSIMWQCVLYLSSPNPSKIYPIHVDGFGVVSVWGTTWEVPSATWAANILGAWRSFCAAGERPTTSPRKKKRIWMRRRMKLDSDCRPPFLVGHKNKISGWSGDEGGSNAWYWGGRFHFGWKTELVSPTPGL